MYLELPESEKIAAVLQMDVSQFNNQFCDLQDRRRLVLKKNSDESCIFLTADGCSIYFARPEQCRDFPMIWRTQRSELYCKGLKGL